MQKHKNRRWILLSRPKPGPFDAKDFRLEESNIPPLKENEFLVETSLISFDPAQRVWMERDSYVPKIPLGEVVRALACGSVVDSKSNTYPVGTRVAGLFGWQDFAVCGENEGFRFMKIPSDVPDAAALSIFGLTGLTGYFGISAIGKPRAQETVLVSGASGATGSVAAQVAKSFGAKVIGIAGGQGKCDWLLQKAKLDGAIDYKSEDVGLRLKSLAPLGIDVYFDNVGGTVLDTALANMAMGGRVVLCGAISTYDGLNRGAIQNYVALIPKRVRMEGFIVTDYVDRFSEGIKALTDLFRAGQLQYEVDIQQGLENAPLTLQRLFDGKNLGKQLLQI